MKRSANFYRPKKPTATSARTCELHIDGLSHDGRGMSRIDGKRVFVTGALPGEAVQAKIVKELSRYSEAQTLRVIQPAAERVTPPCPHYKECGGCTLQHLHDDAQIGFKQAQLLDQIRRFGATEPDSIAAPLTGPSWGYRRRARISLRFDAKAQCLRMGFRASKNSRITDIHQCPVLDPRAEALLKPLRHCLQQLKNPRQLGHLEIAFGDHDGLVLLRTTADLAQADHRHLREFAEQHQIPLLLQPAEADSLTMIWPDTADATEAHAAASRFRLHYELCDGRIRLSFSPSDFTQINADINRQMVDRALALLAPKPGDRILDLFCGLGNFTLPLAAQAGEVVGIEGQASMVKRGEENARLNQLDNVSFYAADLTQDCRQLPWFGSGFNKILLDPPRAGAFEVVKQIAHYNPDEILYISCNPATLARDTAELCQRGYRLRELSAMDMFPHTTHVEAMALFEKA